MIRVYPTKHQKKLFSEYIDVMRYLYNKALYEINNGCKATKKALREILLNKETCREEYKWTLDYEYDFRDEVITTLLVNYKSNLEKYKKT